jgi:hypothetical protein
MAYIKTTWENEPSESTPMFGKKLMGYGKSRGGIKQKNGYRKKNR